MPTSGSRPCPLANCRGALWVGAVSHPRGGPMITGQASHQVGLDADIWLTPMPDRELTRREREEMSATMIVATDRKDVDPNVWTPAHFAIIKAAAEEPEVQRIFVNAAIKKALCREAGTDRAWLSKVRQYWQPDYHFHVRIGCPAAGGRRLRQGPRLVVQRRCVASKAGTAAKDAARAAATSDVEGSTTRV